jgi:hypothetical protein
MGGSAKNDDDVENKRRQMLLDTAGGKVGFWNIFLFGVERTTEKNKRTRSSVLMK